jgi:putative transposase
MIDCAPSELPLTTQAELLDLNRTGLYYVPVPPSPEEVFLKRRIDELYTAHPFYGSRRITVVLRKERPVTRKTVQSYMQEMGLVALQPRPNLSRPAPNHQVFPYLLRGLTIQHSNHVWGVDITYIRLRGGWLYLVAILDWFSSYIVSWELDQTLELPFVLSAAQSALALATPIIWNSDQGSQFTSPQYTGLLQAAGTQISMDGRGRAFDNIFVERLWRTVKYEEVYLNEYRTVRQAREGIGSYLPFHYDRRYHQALGNRTPRAVYGAEVLRD